MSNVETKCSKKAGEPCRIHRPELLQRTDLRERFKKEAFIRELKAQLEAKPGSRRVKKKLSEVMCSDEERAVMEAQAARELEEKERIQRRQELMVADMERNMKKTVDLKTFTTTVSIFRSGVPSAPEKRGVEHDSYAYADSFKPEDRQGRMDGVFASPTMFGVTRWLRGNQNMSFIKDYDVRELRVNPDTTYVYSVRGWEKASSFMEMYPRDTPEHIVKREQAMKEYWDSGVTLTQWYRNAASEQTDPGDWELLLSQDDIKGVKPVSGKRLIESAGAGSFQSDVERIVKRDESARRRNRRDE